MSCFGGHDEQIYLAEILIDKLTLTPSKIKDIGGHPIAIKIKLLDFPVFEITRDRPDGTGRDVRFAIGKCCLFVKRPRDLVRALRASSLRVGVFRAGDSYPTAETELTLPGCLCDQTAMIGNDHPPRPFSVKGGFHLVDPGENPSGTLHIELTIECLGRVVATQHELRAESHVVAGEERELRVRRFVPSDFLAERDAIPRTIETAEAAEMPEDKKRKKKVKAAKKKKRKKGKK